MRRVRFRTLGCYPLTAAIESDAATLPEIVAEMFVARTSERQGRLIDHDEAGVDGNEEARGLFLMAAHDSLETEAFAAFLAENEGKGLLRFLTCGSVDDGKSTLIGRLLYDSKRLFEDQLATLKSDSTKLRHDRRRHRFRAPRRRPRRRARAGHHHRRRLPLLRHRPAPLHRRRHARPRAVHAQHGDRRLELRSRRAPRRCAATASSPRPGATPISSRSSASGNVVLAVNKIDLVGFDEERFDDIRERLRRVRRRSSSFEIDRRHPAIARATATTSSTGAPSTPWYRRPDAARASRDGRTSRTASRRRAVPLPGAVGQPARTRFPRLCRHGRRRHASGPATSVVVARTGAGARVARIVTLDGDLAARRRRHQPSRSPSTARSMRAAATSSPRRRTRPEVTDQFAAHLIWMATSQLLPGRPYLLKSATRTVGAAVSELKHRVDIESFKPLAAKTLGAQRHRPRQPVAVRADRLRPLRREPDDRLLHPDRPLHQRDGRGRA